MKTKLDKYLDEHGIQMVKPGFFESKRDVAYTIAELNNMVDKGWFLNAGTLPITTLNMLLSINEDIRNIYDTLSNEDTTSTDEVR